MELDEYCAHLPPMVPPDDVHAMSRHLLAVCPVAHSDQDGGFWIVNRHADLSRVMQDWHTFETGTRGVYVPNLPIDRPAMAPLEINAPEHRRVKDILSRFLTPQALRPLEDRIREIIAGVIEEFAADGECDIAQQLAKRFPADVITELFFGVTDPLEITRLRDWTRLLTYEMLSADPAHLAKAQNDWRDWCLAILEDRRQSPRNDVPTALVSTAVDDNGSCLADEESVGVLQLFLLAGFGTTSDATSSIIARLIEEPGLESYLRENPDSISAAVEEALRLEPPVTTRPRRPLQDVTISDVEIPKGDRILCNYVAANVDPDAWEDANSFRLDRAFNKVVTFGVGPHRCSGVTLARMELRLMVEELLKRVGDIRWDGEARPTRVSYMATVWRGVDKLPIAFTPKRSPNETGGSTQKASS